MGVRLTDRHREILEAIVHLDSELSSPADYIRQLLEPRLDALAEDPIVKRHIADTKIWSNARTGEVISIDRRNDSAPGPSTSG